MCVAASATTEPPSRIEPASSKVNEVMMKSGDERAPSSAIVSGARLVKTSSPTKKSGDKRLDIACAPWFGKSVDGHVLALTLPLG